MNSHTFTTKKGEKKGGGKVEYPHYLTLNVTSVYEALELINQLSGGLLRGPEVSAERPISLMLAGDFTGEGIARLAGAMQLLARATKAFEHDEPDKNWFVDYFTLTGEHMVLTEEGWISGADYEGIDDQHKPEILAELNNPEGIDRSFGAWRARMIREAQEQGEIEFEETVYVIAEVLTNGLHLTRDGEDMGVFSYEVLKERGAVLRGAQKAEL